MLCGGEELYTTTKEVFQVIYIYFKSFLFKNISSITNGFLGSELQPDHDWVVVRFVTTGEISQHN